jgi:3-phenylpropionate/trans-cinnamate dioxygenase ferredoxin reductase subunit
LQESYAGARTAVIIGAGFIGMEVAATLTQRGIACTVVEMAPRIWPAIVPPPVSDFIRRYYAERGVAFRFGVAVRAIEGPSRAERVVLADGETLPADLVVAGVGAVLNTELAEDAGLPIERGVVVDEHFQTSDPRIYAIGDIANFPDPVAGRTHLEHWDNALHQGRALGQTLAGRPAPFQHVGYFFSDLFDLSLNMIGYPAGWDDVIVRGDPCEDRFTVVYAKDGTVSAALMVNDDKHFDAWTRLVQARLPVSEALADPEAEPVGAAS